MTLSPKLGVVGISTLWHFRLPLPIQMFIKVASSPRLSGIGMPSPILWSHPLKLQRIVLLSSLLWWELGTNSLITGPGEWLSFRRFTSKLSWSWSWCVDIQTTKKNSCGKLDNAYFSFVFNWHSSSKDLKIFGFLGWFLFYGPSTHFRSFWVRSINLATLFLGKPPRQCTST